MDSQIFVKMAKKTYLPFLSELGFSMAAPDTHTLCYRVDFVHPDCTVTIRHEPPDPHVHCEILGRVPQPAGEAAQNTLEIDALAARYKPQITQPERIAARKRFSTIPAADEEHRMMIKKATDLYLALPLYLASIRTSD